MGFVVFLSNSGEFFSPIFNKNLHRIILLTFFCVDSVVHNFLLKKCTSEIQFELRWWLVLLRLMPLKSLYEEQLQVSNI